ncbi:MAG: transthyretin-like family protein [Solirubrobacterales bacterium]|nr:transthyretin-like family protein [Solirubrobacterales bacterium]
MRFHKLPLAAPPMLAALALALAPSGATAHKHPGSGDCRVSLYVAPRIISVGESATAFGKLTCPRPGGASNRVVRLFEHVHGTPGATLVASTTTDVNGNYEIEKAGGEITTNGYFLVRSHGARSASRPVRVEADVTLSGPPEGTQLFTGHPVTFTGTVDPTDVGAVVILQRQNALTGNEWHWIGRTEVVAGGAFTLTHVFRYPGDADIRVLVRSQGRNIPSPSNVLTYEISQAQNPALTIESSADPITFGGSAIIGGKLTAKASRGANQPVTLYARIAGQHFAAVAQSTTNSEGDYSFPAQSPSNSTFYRVKSPHRSSAVLYEGVRYLLTAQVSQTTVQAGMPLTFSGTITPDHTGGIVYLERKDARGPGYHVIQVATIGANSSYSIEHRFYDAGVKTVRVFVPGNPLNGAAPSAPFEIEVTPAPASALMPEAATNITLPAEGGSGGGAASGPESPSGGLEAEAPESGAPAGESGAEGHSEAPPSRPSHPVHR